MLIQLILAAAMVVLTVLILGARITALVRGLRTRTNGNAEHNHFSLKRALGISIIAMALFTPHGIEIWLYGALYLLIDAVRNLEAAVYYSAMTHGSIGFGGSEMARPWLLIGAIGAIIGVLLLGWSRAFFVTVVARLPK